MPILSENPISTAQGILSLVQEDDNELKVYALQRLDRIVHQNWPEIADYITKIETLFEDESFPERQLAASVASKVFYHLEDYEDSLRLALEAGEKFDINDKSQYVETLISKCIDDYIKKQVKNYETTDEAAREKIDPKLENVVERMFDKCINFNLLNQAIGIALESRRIDRLEQALRKGNNSVEILNYTYKIAQEVILSKAFREDVLRALVAHYKERTDALDYFNIINCQFFLNEPTATAGLLRSLINSDDTFLVAYQIAFDLYDNENQQFLTEVIQKLGGEAEGQSEEEKTRVSNITEILKGEKSLQIFNKFFELNNKTDFQILDNIKNTIEQRGSIPHGATVMANALMNARTNNDSFLRNNINWVGKATNWSRFSATASIGIIHQGNRNTAMEVLKPYLQGGEHSSSPFSMGGAYYALGLIHANRYNQETVDYLLNGLRSAAQNETLQHGICLGLGLVAMATGNEAVLEELKTVLYTDSAVAGEAAALAIGLVMLGTANEAAIQEVLLPYAHETQHEKIIRSIALALALIVYGKEENADALIEQLSTDKDPILRYGAMYTIGLAYAGTANNAAIQKLLHYAVSDVTDDVRRAAVSNIGFLLSKSPELVPKLVTLLSESYNPHVRYGATMAVGIACAGTGMPEAFQLLAPMTGDKVDFVRQGALIALSLVFIQTTEAMDPRVTKIRKYYDKIINDKHESVLCKMGAILATGIIDAGGRNTTINLISRSGSTKMASNVGLAVFSHFWYWFPLTAFLSLSLSPSALIGLDETLKIPTSFEFISDAKPSLFAYPEPIKKEKAAEPQKVSTAELSTTTRAKNRAAKKGPTQEELKKEEEKKQKEKAEEEKKGEEKKEEKKEEPLFETKKNPSRVLPKQEKHIKLVGGGRYQPVIETRHGGIVILRDLKKGEAETYYDEKAQVPPATNAAQAQATGNDPIITDVEMPEEFEFDPLLQSGSK